MSIVVYKRFRPLVDGKRKEIKVPYTLYTIDEADAKGIPYDRDWREKFHKQVDLTGVNIVTDDDPPYVVPVIKSIYTSLKPQEGRKTSRPFSRLMLPWTMVASYRRELHVGVRATPHIPTLRAKNKAIKFSRLKLFVVMVALMNDPLKAIQQLFGLKGLVEQKRFLRMIMTDERTYEAASSVARDVFSKADIDPVEVLTSLWEILQDKDTPIGLKVSGRQDLLDRVGVKDKEVPQIQGFLGVGMLPSPSPDMPEKLKSMMDGEMEKLSPDKRIPTGDNGGE